MSQYRGFGGNDLPDPKVLIDQIRRNLKLVLIGGGALLAALLVAGSVFTVEPEEQAIVLRFGSPLAQPFPPGLHFKIPIVDRVHIVPVERQHRVEIGFRSEPGKTTTVHDGPAYDKESLMLTGDLSLAHVRWTVLYKIKDIRAYLFNVQDPEDNVRDVAKGVMRNVIGDYSLDEVLLGKYEEIASEAKRLTQEALDQVESGVLVSAVALQQTEVPPEAKTAFDALNRSVAEVKREIVEAYARRKRVRGEAEQRRQTTIGLAEARRARTVENARGEAGAFLAKLTEYNIAPNVTKRWLFLEAMRKVLGGVQETMVIEESNSSNLVKLLPLMGMDGLPNTAEPATPPPPTSSTTQGTNPSMRMGMGVSE